MDLEKLDVSKIINIVSGALKVMGMGWAGVAAGLVGLLVMGVLLLMWKRYKNKKAQEETERKRKEALAANAGQNAAAEQDAIAAKNEIEEIIDEHEGRQ